MLWEITTKKVKTFQFLLFSRDDEKVGEKKCFVIARKTILIVFLWQSPNAFALQTKNRIIKTLINTQYNYKQK